MEVKAKYIAKLSIFIANTLTLIMPKAIKMRCIPKKDFIVDVITLNRVCLKVRKKSINGLTVQSVDSKNQMLLPDPELIKKKYLRTRAKIVLNI